MVTILPTLEQIRKNLASRLDREAVERVCRELGYKWRSRSLDPFSTLHLFILQVLNQNTAMTHLRHLSGKPVSASAYCQARQRLPVAFFEKISGSMISALDDARDNGRWRGHRVMLVDGSSFSMPDTPELQAHFGQPAGQKPGCGFPSAHMLLTVHGQTGVIRDAMVSPLTASDMSQVSAVHPKLTPDDIVVGDRGFCSYVHLALLSQSKMHAVFRVHQSQIVSFHPHRPCSSEIKGSGMPTSKWISRLGHCDQIVEWRKPRQPPRWITPEQFAALPDKLLVREMKCRIQEPGCRVNEVTLVTTLVDADRYPKEEVAQLYRLRWKVEEDIRDLKTTLGLDVLKGRKVDTVMKELHVFVLVYNLLRAAILKAARAKKVPPRRISFADTMRWLRPAKPAQTSLDLKINPDRKGRVEPRCKKRRHKNYRLMTKPRAELRKQLKRKRDAA